MREQRTVPNRQELLGTSQAGRAEVAKLMLADQQLQRSPLALDLAQRILKRDSEAEKRSGKVKAERVLPAPARLTDDVSTNKHGHEKKGTSYVH